MSKHQSTTHQDPGNTFQTLNVILLKTLSFNLWWAASISFTYILRRWYSENINNSFQKYPKPSIFYQTIEPLLWGFPYSSVGKESACNAGDLGLIPGLGRPPGEGNGNPLQYSCLENLMDRRSWRAIVHGFARIGHDLATKPPPPEPLLQTEKMELESSIQKYL